MGEPVGVWLYAVTGGLEPQDVAGLTGVAGEPVRIIREANLVGVVGTVGLDEYGEEGLRRNLEDLDWLEVVARAHDAVIATVAVQGPVVPLRLATVYLDDDGVRTSLKQRRTDFEAALHQVTGRTEWGVKAYADPQTAIAAETDKPAHGGAGTAYLMRRRAQLSAREDMERRVAKQAHSIHDALVEIAVATRHNALRRPADGQGWPVLNGTYLVDDARAEEFTSAVAALDGHYPGVRVELTGPWPPYSFAGVEEFASGEEEGSG